jgi:hypothetical protein
MSDWIVLCSIEVVNFSLGKGDDEAKFPFRFATSVFVLVYILDWPINFFCPSTEDSLDMSKSKL